MTPSLTHPRECSDRDLSALLRDATGPVVVESHHGGWERPWRGLSPADWRELGRELGEHVTGATIETRGNRESAARHGLEVIPVVLIFVAGEVVARFTGSVPVAKVIEAVRAAQLRVRTLAAARAELETASASRDVLSPPVRSVLRRRTGTAARRSLARAG